MLIQLIIIQIITFLVIVLVLKKLLYNETAKEAARLAKLREEFTRKEKELQVRIDAAVRDAEEKVARAEKEAQDYMSAKEKEAERMKDSLVEKARDKAEDMVKAAVNSKEKIKEEIYNELKGMIPAAALRIFKEALPAEAREMMHEDLVKGVIDKIKKMEKEMFKVKSSRAEFLTPCAVKKQDKEKIAALINERVGRTITLTESLDKALVAGVVIKLDSLIIDGSLENKLKQIQERLK
ncbi:MAG: F0F1 ATP synthase subunit delta [Candidatus Omnitrophota bacterium]